MRGPSNSLEKGCYGCKKGFLVSEVCILPRYECNLLNLMDTTKNIKYVEPQMNPNELNILYWYVTHYENWSWVMFFKEICQKSPNYWTRVIRAYNESLQSGTNCKANLFIYMTHLFVSDKSHIQFVSLPILKKDIVNRSFKSTVSYDKFKKWNRRETYPSYIGQVAMLRTCPNMTLTVKRDAKPQLWLHIWVFISEHKSTQI